MTIYANAENPKLHTTLSMTANQWNLHAASQILTTLCLCNIWLSSSSSDEAVIQINGTITSDETVIQMNETITDLRISSLVAGGGVADAALNIDFTKEFSGIFLAF